MTPARFLASHASPASRAPPASPCIWASGLRVPAHLAVGGDRNEVDGNVQSAKAAGRPPALPPFRLSTLPPSRPAPEVSARRNAGTQRNGTGRRSLALEGGATVRPTPEAGSRVRSSGAALKPRGGD